MSRMVEYDYLIARAKAHPLTRSFVGFFKSLKTVDAVDVVRCRECIHHTDEEPGMVYCPAVMGNWVGNEFYCADGKRKERGVQNADS